MKAKTKPILLLHNKTQNSIPYKETFKNIIVDCWLPWFNYYFFPQDIIFNPN